MKSSVNQVRITSRMDGAEVRRSGMGDKIDELEQSTLTKIKQNESVNR